MPQISLTEVVVILLVALIVFGPSRLPDLARQFGKRLAEVRKMASELRDGLEREVEDIKKPAVQIADEARKAKEELVGTIEWVGPEADSGPKPVDAKADLEALDRGERPERMP